MKRYTLLYLACLSLGIGLPILAAHECHGKEAGTLILEDDFNRDEATPHKENIGNGWTSNSA